MHRRVKSYVLRAGRTSKRQQQALDNWVDNYLLPKDSNIWDLDEAFGRKAETIVEIGFGMGASLFNMAKAKPEVNFIGIEVHLAGVGSLVADLEHNDIENVRIASFDAVEALNNIADGVLSGVQIFFPDPWPKKRHHKRRLIQSEFIEMLLKKLKPSGFIHCATDWEEYAYWILDVLEQNATLINLQEEGGFIPRPDHRPLTKFEKRGQKLGHGVWDMMFEKTIS